jgi:hypothetical protein
MDAILKYQGGNGAVKSHHPFYVGVTRLVRTRAGLGVRERAFLGADISRGAVRVRGLKKSKITQALAAALAGSTQTNVCWALKRLHHRNAILAGGLPLRPSLPTNGGVKKLALPEPESTGNGKLTDDTLFAIFRGIGIEKVLSVAIAVEQAAHRNGAAVCQELAAEAAQ